MSVNRSVDVVVSLGQTALAGQTGAAIQQTKEAIDITNQINGEWARNLEGVRSWRVVCGGLYVVSADTLLSLQKAFMENQTLTLRISMGGLQYTGDAILISFPIDGTKFSQGTTYSAQFLGTGALKQI